MPYVSRWCVARTIGFFMPLCLLVHGLSPAVLLASTVLMRGRPRILKKAELTAWPHNGLRYSFASYHLAKIQDMNKTADPLGTTRT
jgi:hypothetical protein